MEGDEAVQDLVFLNQRSKSKLSASLVASGPAGKSYESICIGLKYIFTMQAMCTSGISMMCQSQWPVIVL